MAVSLSSANLLLQLLMTCQLDQTSVRSINTNIFFQQMHYKIWSAICRTFSSGLNKILIFVRRRFEVNFCNRKCFCLFRCVQFHQPRLVIRTFDRQGRCSRWGHLCNEHSEEKYSCSYKQNSTTDFLIRFCVDKLYECILILMGLGERLWLLCDN